MKYNAGFIVAFDIDEISWNWWTPIGLF